MTETQKIRFGLLVLILFGFGISGRVLVEEFDRPPLQVSFLDVGQGDSILIRTPAHHTILIDGGPDRTVLRQLGAGLPFYQRTIDLLVLTHPDADHVTGIIEVLRRFKVKTILYTAIADPSPVYQEFLRAVAVEQAHVLIAGETQFIPLGHKTALTVLYPLSKIADQTFRVTNDSSIVLRLDFGETSFLFTGDIERKGELALVAASGSLDVDIFQAPHHGSGTSSGSELILAASPELVLISAGRNNRYRHPAQKTLDRFAQFGLPWLLTAHESTILLGSDGQRFWRVRPSP